MRRRRRYKIVIEDQSTLEKVASSTATPAIWCIRAAVVLLLCMALGGLVLFATPVRRLLPGYLGERGRAETEMQLLRLDSLRNAAQLNAAYIDNMIAVLHPEGASRSDRSNVPAIPADSALAALPVPGPEIEASPEEVKFKAMMREREKYNVSVIAPLAAESMMFGPVCQESVFTQASRGELRGEVVLARGSHIAAVADGTVIAVSQSVREGGASVLIQHSKGFLSRINRLGTVLVEAGDPVVGGQVIALPSRGTGRKGNTISVEMWHDGNPLVPYQYIGNDVPPAQQPVIDREVGRGRF